MSEGTPRTGGGAGDTADKRSGWPAGSSVESLRKTSDGTTSWENPLRVALAASAEASASKAVAPNPDAAPKANGDVSAGVPAAGEPKDVYVQSKDASGSVYYYCEAKNDSVWELPTGAILKADTPPTSSSGTPPPSSRKSSSSVPSGVTSSGKRSGDLASTALAKWGAEAKAAPGRSTRGLERGASKKMSMVGTATFVDRMRAWRNTANEETTLKGLGQARGLPIREGLQGMYKIQREKTLFDAFLFICYMFLFIGIVFQLNDVNLANTTNDTVRDLFLDEEFEGAQYKKNFFEIYTQAEFWDWLQGPVINGLYQTEWYNGVAFNESELGYIHHSLRVVGGVQLRQARVDGESCEERRFTEETIDGMPRFDTKDGTCFSEFTVGREAVEPYGPNNEWTWSDGHSEWEGLFGWGPNYGHGGYIVNLPLNSTEAASKVAYLKENFWTDRGTRAVAVNFNLYNTNTKMTSVIRFTVEFFRTGHMVKSFKLFTFKFVVYQSRLDTLRMIGEIVFLMGWGYYVQKEARTLKYHKPIISYFGKFRNLFEVTVIVLIFTLAIMWIIWISDDLHDTFTVNATEFVDMYHFAVSYISIFTLAGFICLLFCLKLFKFFSISKKMNALWMTLYRAATDLLAFLAGFVVLVAGFAILAMLTFGFILPDFHNFPSSFSTLLRFPLGDFSYDELSIARPAIAGIFFTLYVGMVFLVCMNMIIGIVTKYFDEVHQELRESDKWKLSTVSWEVVVLQRAARRWRWFRIRACKCCRCCAASDMAEQNRIAHGKKKVPGGSDGASLAKATARTAASAASGGGGGGGDDGTGDGTGDPVAEASKEDAYGSAALNNDELISGDLAKETEYLKQLRRVMHISKRTHNVDLYRYFDQIFTSHVGRNMFIGLHELCRLTANPACPAGSHKTCEARKLMDLYNAWKNVIIIGHAKRHTMSTRNAEDVYEVTKINIQGKRQLRTIALDTVKFQLLNYTRRFRLKKQLPLLQLIQIERSHADLRRLSLVFTSVGYTDGDLPTSDLETVYHIIFDTPELREHFASRCLDLAAKVHKAAKETEDGVAQPTGKKPGAQEASKKPQRHRRSSAVASHARAKSALLSAARAMKGMGGGSAGSSSATSVPGSTSGL